MFRSKNENKKIAHQVILIGFTIAIGAVTVGMLKENPYEAKSQEVEVKITNNFQESLQEYINDRF